ncbi:MAG: biotin--[acetyl-CoA-carboxylase] ligase [Chitinophagaceae bacterium]|jgi:BirA family biotin operon repressor/biotin-[acetyl-CoA-carboxylase] ligase|nr:biotin--[acetyl-CoA-carboxylase] ligase [Chitinophagaceae bacterium]
MQHPIAHTFHELTTIDSTNLHAMQQCHAGLATHGEVFFAHAQVAGRGQRGKQWWSVAGQNIALSVVLDTLKLAASERFRLSAAVAVGVHSWLQTLAAGPWKIKWPNDIYYGDRKAGGILIENLVQGGKWSRAIVGIGLNMNQHVFPEHLPNPISLKQITGRQYVCAWEAKELCNYLEYWWQQLLAGEGEHIMAQYNDALFGRGEVCRLRRESAVIPCVVQKVNDQGQLIAGENGEYVFEFGEVQWVL